MRFWELDRSKRTIVKQSLEQPEKFMVRTVITDHARAPLLIEHVLKATPLERCRLWPETSKQKG